MMNVAAESAAVERIRKKIRNWPRARWVILTIGIVAMGMAIGMLVWAHGNAEAIGTNLGGYTPVFMFMFAILGTKIELLFALGLFMVVWVASRWHGRPEDLILLALADRISALSPTEKGSDG